MFWQTRSRSLDLSRHAAIMGVVNLTPDSFSDGGRWSDPAAAAAHACTLAAAGAGIIDLGGESTRPGAGPVPVEEELRRVLPVLRLLAGPRAFLLSVDTRRPAVARAALELGADIVNDITGLAAPAMRDLVREFRAGAIVMHMQGTPQTMQRAPSYGDVVGDIREFFRQRRAAAVASGIDPMQLAFDPGIGFGKTVGHNLALLANLPATRLPDRPLVVGVSRKSFLAKIIGSDDLAARDAATAALTAALRAAGANVFRVHDVAANAAALRITEAILAAP